MSEGISITTASIELNPLVKRYNECEELRATTDGIWGVIIEHGICRSNLGIDKESSTLLGSARRVANPQQALGALWVCGRGAPSGTKELSGLMRAYSALGPARNKPSLNGVLRMCAVLPGIFDFAKQTESTESLPARFRNYEGLCDMQYAQSLSSYPPLRSIINTTVECVDNYRQWMESQ